MPIGYNLLYLDKGHIIIFKDITIIENFSIKQHHSESHRQKFDTTT